MRLKLFGKDIFEFHKNKTDAIFSQASLNMSGPNKSKYLPDFHSMTEYNPYTYISIAELTPTPTAPVKKGKEPRVKLTPKGVYELKLLNASFTLNTDPKYIDEQIQEFKDKLDLIKMADYDMSRGQKEIESVITRMENRKKYAEFQEFFDEYVYTTPGKVGELLAAQDYLQLGKVEQFLADMPKEATQAMKNYTAQTEKLCEKKAVFYIIADKADFKKSEKRRDPILLAQSPFGHVWQILGAWDKEMLLLEDL